MLGANASMYRKPKIKVPRKLQAPPADQFEKLSNAIKEIQRQNGSKLSFEVSPVLERYGLVFGRLFPA